MTDFDPRRDFRDPERPKEKSSRFDVERETNSFWGWILGGIAVVALLLIALTMTSTNRETAERPQPTPPATTGQATPPAAPATTGQAPR